MSVETTMLGIFNKISLFPIVTILSDSRNFTKHAVITESSKFSNSALVPAPQAFYICIRS